MSTDIETVLSLGGLLLNLILDGLWFVQINYLSKSGKI